MAELRFDTREPFALELLNIFDMSSALVVSQDGFEIVVLFNLPDSVVSDRLYAAEELLNKRGIDPVPFGFC